LPCHTGASGFAALRAPSCLLPHLHWVNTLLFWFGFNCAVAVHSAAHLRMILPYPARCCAVRVRAAFATRFVLPTTSSAATAVTYRTARLPRALPCRYRATDACLTAWITRTIAACTRFAALLPCLSPLDWLRLLPYRLTLTNACTFCGFYFNTALARALTCGFTWFRIYTFFTGLPCFAGCLGCLV